MTGIVFANPELVHLVWLAVALTGGLAVLEFRGRDGLGRFLSAAMQPRLVRTASLARRIVRLVLVFGVLTLGVLALMRPQTPGGQACQRQAVT